MHVSLLGRAQPIRHVGNDDHAVILRVDLLDQFFNFFRVHLVAHILHVLLEFGRRDLTVVILVKEFQH